MSEEIEIKSMDEIASDYAEYRAELERARHIDDACIVLATGDMSDYRIPLSKCNTHEKIVGWVDHLAAKRWITPLVIRQFIRAACGHHGLEGHRTH